MSKRLNACTTVLFCLALVLATSADATCQDVPMANTEEVVSIIEAQELVIRDSQGRIRIRLGIEKSEGFEWPRVTLYDDRGVGMLAIESVGWGTFSFFLPWMSEESRERRVLDFTTVIPTSIQWDTLRMVAEQNVLGWALTQKITKLGLTAFYDESADKDDIHLYLSVNTNPQPVWNTHTGGGRFSVSDREVRAAYKEAGDAVLGIVNSYLPVLSPTQIRIMFYVNTYPVGTWHDGVMKLAGE